VRIERVRIHHIMIPLRSACRRPPAGRREGENLIVEVESSAGVVGLGECLPRPQLTGESVAGSREALSQFLLPELLGRTFREFAPLRAFLVERGEAAEAAGRLAAFGAAETAALDLFAKERGVPLMRLLAGGEPAGARLVYTGLLPAAGAWRAARRALALRLAGFRQIKVKVGDGGGLERVRLVRRLMGRHIDLRVDANAAWNVDEAIERLAAMKAFGLSAAEQPVPAEDLDGLGRVGRETGLDIVADESLTGVESAKRLIERRACRVLNVRVAKCGGLLRSLRIIELAREASLDWQLGCLAGETGVLAAAGRHLACATGDMRHLEGPCGPFRLGADIVRERVTVGWAGRARPLPGPGLGVTLSQRAIERFTRDSEAFE